MAIRRIFVRTVRGSGWIINPHLVVKTGTILVLLQDAHLRESPGVVNFLPKGTFLVYSRKLERETRKKPLCDRRTHMILEEGVYDALRQCAHIREFEVADGAEMLRRIPQMQSVAKDLYVCGQLEFDFHNKIVADLENIRKSFDEYKRAPSKVQVRERLDRTASQRSKKGRFKAMPAAATAYASKRDIQKRLKETVDIHGAFGNHSLQLAELRDEAHKRLDIGWTFFRADAEDACLPPDIQRAMDAHTRSRQRVRTAEMMLRAIKRDVEEIFVLPHCALIEPLCEVIDQIIWNVKQHRRKGVADAVAKARYLMRRMLMLRYLYGSLVNLLAFPSEKGTYQEITKVTFTKRLELLSKRVDDLTDTEFDAELRALVSGSLASTRQLAEADDFPQAYDELKKLCRELRKQPVTHGRKAA